MVKVTQVFLQCKAVSRISFSVAIRNALPAGVHRVSLAHHYRKRPCQLCAGQLVISVCTSLALRPMTVVFNLGMRLGVHMCISGSEWLQSSAL